MPAPRNYVRGYSFAGYQATNPNRPLPGTSLDNELEEIEQSLTEAISGLNDIRRADGALRNGIVGLDALAPDLATGVRPATLWQAGIQYQAQDTVSYLASFYRCTIGHVSAASFLTDLTASRWELYAELGSIATDAQTARNEAVAAAAAAVPAAATATAGSNNVTALYDLFDDRYLGEKTTLPTLDNDGNAIVDGALVSLTGQTPTTLNGMYVRRGGVWQPAVAGFQGILLGYRYVATGGQTVFSGADANGLALAYTLGALIVTVNGVSLTPNTYTASNGTSVVLGTALTAGDVVVIYSFGSFAVANTWTKAEADGRYPQFSDIATGREARALVQDVSRYDTAYMRAASSLAVCEPWAMAPDYMPWENSSNVRTRVTEATTREWVRAQKAAGYRGVWIKYVEIYGHWFTVPSFALWDDRDAAPGVLTPGAQWHTFPNNFSELLADNFDMVQVIVDECARNGLFVLIGLGRVGLFNTLDYVQSGTDGYTGAAALTTTVQMQLAADRTRQLHADFVTRFAAYRPWILAFSSGFEPSDMPTWKTFSTAVTTGAGANPTVKAAGYPWWCTPADMLQLPASGATIATRNTFAQDLRDCNVDTWIVQDAVGPGYDWTNKRYTFVASVPLGLIDGVYARWRRSADDAGVGFGTIRESWRMGSEPPTNLTLSATSGASITATSAFNFFVAGMVGQYITGSVAGNARITAVSSLTQATLDTTVVKTGDYAAGAAFSGTSLSSGTFSLNTGYADPYPADAARLASQQAIHEKYSDEICTYASSAFSNDATLSLRLPQTRAGIFDYRTRAATLYADDQTRFRTAMTRARASRRPVPNVVPVSGAAVTPTGGTWSVTQDRYYPISATNRIIVRLEITAYRGETVAAFINDVTLRLQIDGANAGPSVFTGGKNGVFSGTFVIEHEIANTGVAFTFGASMTWQTAMGNPAISALYWQVREFSR